MSGHLAVGLATATCSAAAINLGFLLQHRGLAKASRGGGAIGRAGVVETARLLRRAVAEPDWLGGQALGLAGFGGQVVAVAIAPLALVQAFAAGGLALSLPLAVLAFGQPVRRSRALAVGAIAVALASLPLGLPPVHESLSSPTLVVLVAAAVGLALAAVASRRPAGLAVAAGLCYGAADAAIKAVSVLYARDGSAALLSGWTAVAVVATATGFACFQAALRRDDAVGAVTVMTAVAALVAVACGLIALSEPFGDRPLVTAGHGLAVAVVLVCVRPLAAAQAELAQRVG